jgi:hypothetical protein
MHIWGFSSLWIGRMDGGRGMFNSFTLLLGTGRDERDGTDTRRWRGRIMCVISLR